ncbi:MAG: maleylpyruvate isomerase family mycothiol-dependent enzyme [Micrococcaceae bacterium]|nr:maleylpyruvate isomerase family mycothiol-dependent enzyme [Micrococcaceae bacterium]
MRLRNAGSVWPVVHHERMALLRDLEDLAPVKWQTPSLCVGWDVHEVLAHLIDAAGTTRRGFIRRMVASGLDFDKDNAVGLTRELRSDPQETLVAFAAVLGRTSTPPAPLATRLVEAFAHGEDIRRPLLIRRNYPPTHVAIALAHQLKTSVKFGGAREPVAGSRLVGTDVEFSHGAGPEVRGRGIDLLLAVCGRPVRSGLLAGEGVSGLAARIAAKP